MARIDSIYEANGHTVTTSTTTFYDDLISEVACTCGWGGSGFLSVARAEEAAKIHAEMVTSIDPDEEALAEKALTRPDVSEDTLLADLPEGWTYDAVHDETHGWGFIVWQRSNRPGSQMTRYFQSEVPIEPLHYEGWSDERIRNQHISIYGSHYAAHSETCGPCARDIAEQERRWARLERAER